MKNKLLVIFFIAIIFSISIYYLFHKDNNTVLLLGEYNEEVINKYKDKNLVTFLYDNITYKELINSIKNNDYIIVKNKKVYLNQLIHKSSKIVISVNNSKDKNKLISIIRLFSNAEIEFCDIIDSGGYI